MEKEVESRRQRRMLFMLIFHEMFYRLFSPSDDPVLFTFLDDRITSSGSLYPSACLSPYAYSMPPFYPVAPEAWGKVKAYG